MASSLYFEMADCLEQLKEYEEAAKYFRKAAELQQIETPLSAVESMKRAFYCCIQWGKGNFLEEATLDLQWIVKIATEQAHETNSQYYNDIKLESTVSLVILLTLQDDLEQARGLLMTIKEQTLREVNTDILDIFSTNEWFFLLLEEAIDLYDKSEVDELVNIHGELSTIFTDIQNQIYLLLISKDQNYKDMQFE